MDTNLEKLLVNIEPSMLLDVGIKASGKLRFLDLILPEVQKRQLRVLILFHEPTSVTSRARGYYSLGEILDDYVHRRFGEDSYEHVDGFGNGSSKKQAAISRFNKEMGRFIFLLESRALFPSVKLSSVDVIIIFDSDLHPANDLRALQKIHIDSKSEDGQIMLFRLYSSSTLEEKILKLAEQNMAIDTSRSQNLRSNYDALLMWGASDLFGKLTDFHNQSVASISSSQDTFLKEVVEEFVSIISDKSKSKKETSKSIITRLQSCGKTTYLQDGDVPHIFWRNLLGGRRPIWKFVSEWTPRQRKRPNHLLDSSSEGTGANAGGVKMCRKTTVDKNTIEPAKLKPVTEERETGGLNEGGSGVPAHKESQSLSGVRFRSTAVTNEMSLYDLLKPTVFELCDVLKFTEDVKVIVGRFLEYVLENYYVPRVQTSSLQAFMISLCWIGSSLAQLKIDRMESFAVAKKHFRFSCMEEQTDLEYTKLKPVKEMFLQHSELPTDALKDRINIPGPGSQGAVRLEEETEKCQDRTQSESSNHEEEANRCKNQTEHLSCKEDQQEYDKFNKEWEKKRVSLENDYRVDKALICRLHRSTKFKSEKIKDLDKEFANKLEQHKRLRETCLEDLKAKLVSLHGENQVVAAPSAKGNDIESPGSHTSGKQTTNPTASLIGEALAPQSYDDMEEEDVTGKVDLEAPEVDFHQENATATSSSPNMSHAVEHRSETGAIVESGDMGMPAGDVDTSSHAIQDHGPDDNDVVLPVPAEMGRQAGNCDKEIGVVCSSATLHAGEEDQNEINLADSVVMGTHCNDEIGPNDASHDTTEEERNNDSCGNLSSAAAVSQDNAASVDEAVASVAIFPEIQNESLAEGSIENNEGEAGPSLFAENIVDDVQSVSDGCDIREIIPVEDPLLDPRNYEEVTLSDRNLEQRDLVADGEHQPSFVSALNMFDNLNTRVGSSMPNQTVDALQAEVERLYAVKDTVTKFHEEMKQRLTTECEKEIAEMIAQIRLKYKGKCLEAEAAYDAKKKQLETTIDRVVMNRMLAEAFRSR